MRGQVTALLALLVLGGCDAGPSAVVHDGDGKAPSAGSQKTPVWADKGGQPPVATANDDEASMPIPGQTSAPSSGDLARRDLEAAKSYGPMLTPSGPRGAITTTSYGDYPLWSSNRKYSADDNAHYQFAHHGAEIGATSYEDYLAAVHGFIHHPPAGTQTLTRSNGDTVMYDPKSNVFAVMTRDGAPRTLFRPYDGDAYWEKQKQIEANGGWHGNGGGGD